MKRVCSAVFCLIALLFAVSASGAEQDVKGSKDHPLISRMPNFHITSYDEKEYEKFVFYSKGGHEAPVEGHYYMIEYRLNSGAPLPGALQVVRNIQNALTKIGGKVIYDTSSNSTIVLQKDGKETWVDVGAWPPLYRIHIVEKVAMKQEVTADAAAMGSDIRSTGHAAIYGIYFDTGKSTIKPESDAAISEIAKLLKSDGTLKVYVVGHTDNVGSFDSNMKLSRDRADAVAKELVTKHGIVAGRLKAVGVGPSAPVASNRTEEGKAQNRRVELVEQ